MTIHKKRNFIPIRSQVMNLMKALRGSDVSRKILNVSDSNGNIGTPEVLYNNLLRFCGCLHNMKAETAIVPRITIKRNIAHHEPL